MNHQGPLPPQTSTCDERETSYRFPTWAVGTMQGLELSRNRAGRVRTGRRKQLLFQRDHVCGRDDRAVGLDAVEAPLGMGWWDVTPDQVNTGTSQIPMDTAQFATCRPLAAPPPKHHRHSRGNP
jgi:hypothetical protein